MKSIWLIFFLGWFSSCAGRQEKVHLCQEWKYDLAATRQEMAIREASFAETSYMESIMAGLQFARIRFLITASWNSSWIASGRRGNGVSAEQEKN
ncbi:MAG: hypothetical protein IPH16_18060 [Haliscomenobacter sp.]|nr:hypothetical protein [Haliscomenobacter sp.]